MITQPVGSYITFISKINKKMIAIHLSKQKALAADPKAKHQINFTGNVEENIFSLLKKQKKPFQIFKNQT